MRARLLFPAVMVAIFLVTVLAVVVYAQDGETPPPYAGQKNPFPWDDASAQGAGKDIFRRSCQGCHGPAGAGIAAADFSTGDFSQKLETQPDFYYWKLSEGELRKGMPPFKSSLSDDERWQVLTYLRVIGETAPPEPGATPAAEPVPAGDFTLYLLAPEKAESGQVLTLSAALRDAQNEPVTGKLVKFYVEADFFTTGLMEIGDAVTDDDGIAVMEYVPRQSGEVEIRASYASAEAAVTINFPEEEKVFYHTEAGIKFPALGEGRFIGPEELQLGEQGHAPATVFRLPSGTLFWLAPILWLAMTIWIVYFYVLYQVFRIPVLDDTTETDTRRIPIIGMVFVALVGIVLVLMLVTSPISHP
ncbi:MAG: c-type cytochrome [Chloroflexota bacterium]